MAEETDAVPSDAPPPGPPPAAAARGAAGAVAGAGVGVAAWALLASVAGFGTGFVSLLVGALAGAGSRLLGGRGIPAAAVAAGIALAGTFAGLGFAARAEVEERTRGALAAVDREAYDDFAAAAEAWDPRLRGEEVAKFAYRFEFVAMDARGGTEERVAAFARTTVPLLEAWKKAPPPFERWREERRAEILRGPGPWGAYLRAPLDFVSPLDLLCALLGAAAAARIAFVPLPLRIVRKRRGGSTGNPVSA